MDDAQIGDEVSLEEEPRGWRPSLRPEYKGDDHVAAQSRFVVELPAGSGIVFALKSFFRRPFVRLVIGLGLFIFCGILYDATINGGSWTIKAEKQKASIHHGAQAIPLTPK